MPDVKWIKLDVSMFDDEKIILIESMPDADEMIVIWIKLLCFAGKQNNRGVFVMNDSIPYTDEMLAIIFRREAAAVKRALAIFEEYGMITRADGIVAIPKWGKHQSLDQLESKREYMREYMAGYRQKQKQIMSNADGKVNSKVNGKVNVNPLDKDKEREKNKNIYSSHFEEFWDVYPRKSEKGNAYRAYQARLKDGFTEAELLKAAEGYAEKCKKDGREQKYIKLGATFLAASTPFTDYLDDTKGGVLDEPESSGSFRAWQ